MNKSKRPGYKDDLDISLDSKIVRHVEDTSEVVSVGGASGFDAIDKRVMASGMTKATVATTVRLSENSDVALRKACSQFGTSKADLIKSCVEEYLRAKKFLDQTI